MMLKTYTFKFLPTILLVFSNFAHSSCIEMYMHLEKYNGKSWLKLPEKITNDTIGRILQKIIHSNKAKQTEGFCCSNENNIGAIRIIYPACNDIGGLRYSDFYITNASKKGESKQLTLYWIEGIGQYSEGKFFSLKISQTYSKRIKRLFQTSKVHHAESLKTPNDSLWQKHRKLFGQNIESSRSLKEK